MNRHLGFLTIVTLAAGLALSACGGGAGDPTAPVREVFKRMEARQFDQIAELICSAERAEMSERLDIVTAMAAQLPGVDAQQLLNAMTIKTSDLNIVTTQQSGDKGIVHVKGQMTIAFDPAQFKEILRVALEQSLGPVDDSMLEQMVGPILAEAEQSIDFDSDVDVVNENGQWLVCGTLFGTGP